MPKDMKLVAEDSGEEEDPNMSQKEIRKTLKKRACTMTTSILAELLICYVYTNWSVNAEQDERMAAHAELHDVNSDVNRERVVMWCVFGFCLIARFLCIFGWMRDCGPDSVWAALNMFFSSVPFICYWIIFFSMKSQLLVRETSVHVPSAYHKDNVSGIMAEECTTPFSVDDCEGSVELHGVACCMWHTSTLTMAGGGVVPLFGYAETMTIGSWYSMILKWASILCMSWIWKDMPMLPASGSDKAFMDDVWIDILDAAVFSDYVISPWVQASHFNIFNDGTSGGSHNGRQCVDGMMHTHDGDFECSGFLQQAIFAVWLVAFFSSIISPTLWTMFRFCDKDSADSKDIEGLLGDFTTHIRLLDADEAKEMVDDLIDEQVNAYRKADGNREDQEHPVMVGPEGGQASGTSLFEAEEGAIADLTYAFSQHESEMEENRPGVAQYNPGTPGFYDVTYSDGKKPKAEPVHLSRLQPDAEDHRKLFGKNCCKGWCTPSYLKSEDRPTQEFERRGNYYDSLRSCFLLELPFFIYRFHFIVLSGGSTIGAGTILLLKNAIFMCLDFLHVLACGNVKATCLNYTPIDKFEKFVKGSKLNNIFVGPGGMFKLAADLTTKGLLEKAKEIKDRLNQHKAWLILEREKAQKDRDDPEKEESERAAFTQECEDFTKAIKNIEKSVKKIDTEMKAVHM